MQGKNWEKLFIQKRNFSPKQICVDALLQLVLCALTRFFWRSGEGSFNGAAVGVVSTTNATFVLNFAGANLSVAADFLKGKKTISQMR